jgi:hypothetical protein
MSGDTIIAPILIAFNTCLKKVRDWIGIFPLKKKIFSQFSLFTCGAAFHGMETVDPQLKNLILPHQNILSAQPWYHNLPELVSHIVSFLTSRTPPFSLQNTPLFLFV